MRKLTLKQKLFVSEYLKSRNGTSSAMKIYNVKNRETAKSIASENLSKPYLKDTIDKHLIASGYNPLNSIANLQEVEAYKTNKITGADKINASKTLLSLAGLLQERKLSTNYNLNIDNLDRYELNKLQTKYNKLLQKQKPNTQNEKL